MSRQTSRSSHPRPSQSLLAVPLDPPLLSLGSADLVLPVCPPKRQGRGRRGRHHWLDRGDRPDLLPRCQHSEPGIHLLKPVSQTNCAQVSWAAGVGGGKPWRMPGCGGHGPTQQMFHRAPRCQAGELALPRTGGPALLPGPGQAPGPTQPTAVRLDGLPSPPQASLHPERALGDASALPSTQACV